MKPVIYQICESKLAWRKRDAGYLVLQTGSSEPVFLQRLNIVQQVSAQKDWKPTQHYGFFDSGFFVDTRLSSRDVLAHVSRQSAQVISFCPWVDVSAGHWNSIAAAELHCANLQNLIEILLDALHLPPALAKTEMTFRESVLPAYTVASGAVWTKWLGMARTVMQISQSPLHAASEQLNGNALVNGELMPVQQIVLDILLTLLITHERSLAVDTYFPYSGYPEGLPEHNLVMMGNSARDELLILDGLKCAYRNTAMPLYEEAFLSVRRVMMDRRLHLKIWNEGAQRAQQRHA